MPEVRRRETRDDSEYTVEVRREFPPPGGYTRERDRERDYYEEDIDIYSRRPEFLREEYGRSDGGPLVRRERERETYIRPSERERIAVPERERERERGSSPPAPAPIVIRQRRVERSPSPVVERVRTRIIERERPITEERYVRRERTESPRRERERSPSVENYAEVFESRKTTRYREVDEVVWDLTRTKDITMHLELGVTEDLEPDLDEFCRLGRLGNFHQAKHFFRDNLEQYIDDPYVFVQYAQMLMEMGDYKSVKALNAPYSLEEPDNHLLQTNWKLVKSLSTLYSEGLVERDGMISAEEAAVAAAAVAAAYVLPGDSVSVKEDSEKGDDEYPKAGKTRMPARLVSKKAIIELGYPYEEQGDVIVIQKALGRENIDEVLKLSGDYKRPGTGLPYSSLTSERARVKAIGEAKVKLRQLLIDKIAATHDGDESRAAELQYYAIPKLEARIKTLENEQTATDADDQSFLGSTECQILNLSLRFLAHPQSVANVEIGKFDWETIYEDMLRQGRVWDFRDIFCGATLYYGQEQVCDEMFGDSVLHSLDRIIQDWSTAIYDESTNLALLDILVSLFLAPLSPKTVASTKRLIDQAGHLASSIVQNKPSNLKSRQYIGWILAKVAVTSYRDVLSSNLLSELPGLFLANSPAVEPYIYVPAASEAPDWQFLCLPSKTYETQQMVLKAARQIGDLETEARCLEQLIAHSRDPTEYFDELIRLQKTVQNDIEGCLRTCLSKYIICRDKESRDGLREEILSVKDYGKLDTELVWARSMVLRALADSEHEANLSLDEARKSLEGKKIAANISDFMKRNELVDPDVPIIEIPPASGLSTVGENPDGKLTKEELEAFYHFSKATSDLARGKSVPADVDIEEAAATTEGKTSIKKEAEGPRYVDGNPYSSTVPPPPPTGREDPRYVDENPYSVLPPPLTGYERPRYVERSLVREFSPPPTGRSPQHPVNSKAQPANFGATKDWAIVDVPPGTERVKLNDLRSGSQEITWQRYNGTRRTRFLPERENSKPAAPIIYPASHHESQSKASDIPPYNPADYAGLQPLNPDPKQQQKLSGIYVTIDEAASEPEAGKPTVNNNKKQNGITSTSNRELEPEVSSTRRPPAVTVSSAQEEAENHWSNVVEEVE